MQQDPVYVIGIAGPSGSGKTTLANTLLRLFPNDVLVLSMDSYYQANWGICFEERAQKNYDEPQAFDIDLMQQQLQALKNHQGIQSPVYDFTNHQRSKETSINMAPKKIIIVEGILLLHADPIRSLLDLMIFVSTPIEECKYRRIHRDCKERGRNEAQAVVQYETTVQPMLEKYVLPSKQHADLAFEMFPDFQHNPTFQTIVATITSHLNEDDTQASSAQSF